jgi:hypothetical protein
MSDTAAPCTFWQKLTRFLDRNFLTLVSLALVVYVLVWVPQIFTIWFEVPRQLVRREGVSWMEGLFVCFIYGTLVWYVAAWLIIRTDALRRPAEASEKGASEGRLRAAIRFVLYGWLVDLAARVSGTGRYLVGFLLIVAGIGLGVGAYFEQVLDSWRPLAGLGLAPFAVLIGVTGLWLLLLEGRARGPNRDHLFEGFTGLLGRYLGFVVLATLAGEVIWWLAHSKTDWISYRVFTIWAVFHICFLITALAAVLDAWHEDWKWPIRELTVAFLLVYALSMFFLKPDLVGESIQPASSTDRPPDWYDVLLERIQATHEGHPVVIVTASGGGSRAAYFAGLVYEALKHQPLTNSKKEPLYQRNADGTSGDPLHWSDQIILISSVSGGSLATAYHVNNPGAGLRPAAKDLHNSFGEALQGEALRYITGELPRKTNPDTQTLKDIYYETWKGDSRYERTDDPVYRQTVDAATKATKKDLESILDDDDHRWMVTSILGDDMCTDFMAPLLRGFMTPGGRRGIALSRFWQRQFNWDGSNNRSGYAGRGYGDEKSRSPLVLFNATRVQSGCRHIIGFPPLPEKMFNEGDKKDLDWHDFLADGAEYHTLTLADFDPNYRVSLAEAVRLSANFPWGVRAGRLHSDTEAAGKPVRFPDGDLILLDGGVNDNSGVASVWDVFDRLSEMAGKANPNTSEETARKILLELQRRGVYFLEIDSGARPNPDRLPELRTPAQGLDAAAYSTAEEMKKRDTDQLNDLFTPATPVKKLENAVYDPENPDWNPFGFGHMAYYQFQCNHNNFEVMTAWALSPKDKAKILATFFWEFREWSEIELQQPDFLKWLAGWEEQARKGVGVWKEPTGSKMHPGIRKEKEKAQKTKRSEMQKLN